MGKKRHCNDMNNEYFNDKSCQQKIVCNLFEESVIKQQKIPWGEWEWEICNQQTDWHSLSLVVTLWCMSRADVTRNFFMHYENYNRWHNRKIKFRAQTKLRTLKFTSENTKLKWNFTCWLTRMIHERFSVDRNAVSWNNTFHQKSCINIANRFIDNKIFCLKKCILDSMIAPKTMQGNFSILRFWLKCCMIENWT